MGAIEYLIEQFGKFPGVGPRQAKRFAYYLLSKDNESLKRFAEYIVKAKKDTAECTDCRRYFSRKSPTQVTCKICADTSRDEKLLLVVGHDVDIDAIEKGGVYSGRYFVLGGLLAILEKKPEERIRSPQLLKSVNDLVKHGLSEIILALDVNPEGEYTTEYIARILKPLAEKTGIKISILGRGLSTGTELEYSDPETIKNALRGRIADNS